MRLAGGCFRLPLDHGPVRVVSGLNAARHASYVAGKLLMDDCWRRGGKTFTMALMAIYLAEFRDWTPKLSPDERAVVLSVAADREQAKILHRYIAFSRRRCCRRLCRMWTADSIEFNGSVVIDVVTPSYRSVRSRRICVALMNCPVGPGNRSWILRPGALSTISIRAPWRWATAATRLRPSPLPGVRRLCSSR
jgi:hypothetical protein